MLPTFSIPPQLNSGTKTWSDLSNGYGSPPPAARGTGPTPAPRSGHRQVIRRLEVGLVETREQPVGGIRLELGVEILPPVFVVGEGGEGPAGLVVGGLVDD